MPGRTSGVKMVGMAEVRAPITPDGWQSIHTVGTSACIIFILHPYLLTPYITIHGILPVQFTCLTVFFHNLQVFFDLPLGLAPSTSYSIHFFTHISSFHSTCPYNCNLFCSSSEIMSSNPSLSLNPLLGTIS